jgi:multidrug efflux pump subunit AcrA (membrane-fusion protein)
MNGMKKVIFILAIFFVACKEKTETTDPKVTPKTSVEITNIHYGSVSDNLELFATTLYLKRSIVTAPIPSYVTKVFVHLGEKVNEGQSLYELQSKERRALGDDALGLDTSLTHFGTIVVKAPTSGIVTTFDKQQTGDYLLEGTQLCTIAQSNDLAFQVNVPYEFLRYIKPGKICTVVLPDNSEHHVTITTPLSAMNMTAQTQSVLAKTAEEIFLPENLIVKVLVSKTNDNTKQVLPKSCVQSDEMMKNFWIMKLINDSSAIKVPVTIGNRNQTDVEIISPQFDSSDRIILNGSYGLSDTAFVRIEK